MRLAVFPLVDFHEWIYMTLQWSNFIARMCFFAELYIIQWQAWDTPWPSYLKFSSVGSYEIWFTNIGSLGLSCRLWVPPWLSYWDVKTSPLCVCLLSCSSTPCLFLNLPEQELPLIFCLYYGHPLCLSVGADTKHGQGKLSLALKFFASISVLRKSYVSWLMLSKWIRKDKISPHKSCILGLSPVSVKIIINNNL